MTDLDTIVAVSDVELSVDGEIVPGRGDAEIGRHDLVRAAIPRIEVEEDVE